jgi:hypothetical protein
MHGSEEISLLLSLVLHKGRMAIVKLLSMFLQHLQLTLVPSMQQARGEDAVNATCSPPRFGELDNCVLLDRVWVGARTPLVGITPCLVSNCCRWASTIQFTHEY